MHNETHRGAVLKNSIYFKALQIFGLTVLLTAVGAPQSAAAQEHRYSIPHIAEDEVPTVVALLEGVFGELSWELEESSESDEGFFSCDPEQDESEITYYEMCYEGVGITGVEIDHQWTKKNNDGKCIQYREVYKLEHVHPCDDTFLLGLHVAEALRNYREEKEEDAGGTTPSGGGSTGGGPSGGGSTGGGPDAPTGELSIVNLATGDEIRVYYDVELQRWVTRGTWTVKKP